MILRYRKLQKVLSTCKRSFSRKKIDIGFAKDLDPLVEIMQSGEITDSIHTNWNQEGTATGRISSSKPNIQVRSAS